jgi:hypothetical protein
VDFPDTLDAAVATQLRSALPAGVSAANGAADADTMDAEDVEDLHFAAVSDAAGARGG